MNRFFKMMLLAIMAAQATIAVAQDGRWAAMANSSVTQFGLWSAFNNQAGLAEVGKGAVGIDYHNQFNMSETSTKAAAGVVATNSGNFALCYSRFGYSLYSEDRAGLAYARHLGDKILVGVQFDYLRVNQTSAYGDNNVFLVEVGMIAKPIDRLYIGAHVFNPTMSKMDDYVDSRVDSRMRLGGGYYFSKDVQLTAEAEMDFEANVRFKCGIEYQIISQLFLRTGFASHPNTFTAGMGYTFKGIELTFAFASHQYLSSSTQFSLSYNF